VARDKEKEYPYIPFLGRLKLAMEREESPLELAITLLKEYVTHPEELEYICTRWPKKVAVTPSFLAKARAAGAYVDFFYSANALSGKSQKKLFSAYRKANSEHKLKMNTARNLYRKRVFAARAAYKTAEASAKKAHRLAMDRAFCEAFQDVIDRRRLLCMRTLGKSMRVAPLV
jgi:hypothetical protein